MYKITILVLLLVLINFAICKILHPLNDSIKMTRLNKTTKIALLKEINSYRNQFWIKYNVSFFDENDFKRENLKVIVS